MASPEIKQNRKKVDPGLKDLLDLYRKEIFLNFNCHAIGTVQSFDSSNQTVTATVNYKKVFLEMQSDNTYKNVLVDYPILIDAPVVILGGGPWKLTFPISAGDECLILFNDRDIDNWFSSGQVAAPATQRMHSFSDGIVLVGLLSMSNSIGSYDSTRAVLKNHDGGAMVGVSDTKVKLSNETTTLNTLLQDLVTAIKGLTTTNTVPGAPAAISAASQLVLTNLATQIQGLLE